MDANTLLPSLALVLPSIISAIDRWREWRNAGRTAHPYVMATLLLMSLVVGWFLINESAQQQRAQLAQAVAQSEQLRVQKQDLEARLIAQDKRSRLIAEAAYLIQKCESRPKPFIRNWNAK